MSNDMDASVQKPRNTAELLRWLVFEPNLLREYSDTIKGRPARLKAMIAPLCWIAFGAFLLYGFFVVLIAALAAILAMTKKANMFIE